MTLAELRELCERDCGEDFAAGILADEQIAAAARTWLPALIEVAEAATQDRCCRPYDEALGAKTSPNESELVVFVLREVGK